MIESGTNAINSQRQQFRQEWSLRVSNLLLPRTTLLLTRVEQQLNPEKRDFHTTLSECELVKPEECLSSRECSSARQIIFYGQMCDLDLLLINLPIGGPSSKQCELKEQ